MENYNSSSSGPKSSLQKNHSYFPGNDRQPQAQPTSPPMFPPPSIGTTLPTGIPSGGSMGPPPPPSPGGEFVPTSTQSVLFTPGFLKTQIGRRVRVEFLIGTSGTTDRVGTLVGVGANYILLKLIESNDVQLADLYAIKFITFFMGPTGQ